MLLRLRDVEPFFKADRYTSTFRLFSSSTVMVNSDAGVPQRRRQAGSNGVPFGCRPFAASCHASHKHRIEYETMDLPQTFSGPLSLSKRRRSTGHVMLGPAAI